MRRAAALLCIAAAAALAACGGTDKPPRIHGDVATVYTSVPRHGVSVSAGVPAYCLVSPW